MRVDDSTDLFVDDILMHFGVKGMRWGVSRSSERATARAGRKAARKEKRKAFGDRINKAIETHMDNRFEAKANSFEKKVELHNRAGDIMDRHGDIDRINNKSQYIEAASHGILLNSNHPITQKYEKEYMGVYVKRIKEAAAEQGTNWSGTRKLTAVRNDNDVLGFSVRAVDVTHAEDNTLVSVRFVKDDAGRITGFEIVNDAIAQASLFIGETLKHHGVKGMKWGKTTKRSAAPTPKVTITTKGKKNKTKVAGGEGVPIHKDAVAKVTVGQVKKKSGVNALSDNDLKQYASRLELEQRVKRLEFESSSPSKKFIKKLLGQQGSQAANQVASQATTKAVKKGLAKTALAAA